MKITITSIKLKSPFKFFPLSLRALHINRQLKGTRMINIKTQGIWTMHYTMTLWNNEEDLKAFASSGAHLEAMKKSAEIAKEIRTLTMDANEFPKWKEAKALLFEKGRVFEY